MSLAMHLEFVVLGPPISNQQSTPQGRANLAAWRATVAGVAQNGWLSKPLLLGRLKATVINFFDGKKPSVGLDNMSKPVLDALETIVYENDRQIVQAQLTHLKIDGPFAIAGVSLLLVMAIHAAKEFMYFRLEDPVDPFPLPG